MRREAGWSLAPIVATAQQKIAKNFQVSGLKSAGAPPNHQLLNFWGKSKNGRIK